MASGRTTAIYSRQIMYPNEVRGFTVLELIVAFALLGIVLSIGSIGLPDFRAQMRTSEEIRRLALTFSALRHEAIRLRSNIEVKFSADGYSWDINSDGSDEGSYTLRSGTGWDPSPPANVTINGLGLMRGIGGTQNFTIRGGDTALILTVNSNGFVSF